MKTGIHPELFECRVTCSGCGTTFTTLATRPEIRVEVCSKCHPFFTGKQARIVDTEGRVEKFVRKFEGRQTRVSKRKRRQVVVEAERAAQREREAEIVEQKAAEEKDRRAKARRRRAEEQAARKAAQEKAAAEAPAAVESQEAPPPAASEPRAAPPPEASESQATPEEAGKS